VSKRERKRERRREGGIRKGEREKEREREGESVRHLSWFVKCCVADFGVYVAVTMCAVMIG